MINLGAPENYLSFLIGGQDWNWRKASRDSEPCTKECRSFVSFLAHSTKHSVSENKRNVLYYNYGGRVLVGPICISVGAKK